MNTIPDSLDPRAKRWGTFIKYAALGVVGLVVAPYIFTAIMGLAGLLVAAAILGATWMLLPVIGTWAGNMRLKLIKGEAARNPVETLQNDLREKSIALDGRKTNIEKMNGEMRTFEDKICRFKDKYGAQDSGYVKTSEDLVNLKRIYKQRCEKWREAKAQLIRYGEEIERAGAIWEMAQAAAAARESSGLSESEFYAKLKSETAFDAIQKNYNQALASLDTSLLEDTPKVPIEKDILPEQMLESAQSTVNVTIKGKTR